jgi:uncharacterized membrane protein
MTMISLAPIGFGLAIVGGLAFWAVVILLVVLLASAMRTTARAPGRPALLVLEERYARGEITNEEFLERRAVLGGGTSGPQGDESR